MDPRGQPDRWVDGATWGNWLRERRAGLLRRDQKFGDVQVDVRPGLVRSGAEVPGLMVEPRGSGQTPQRSRRSGVAAAAGNEQQCAQREQEWSRHTRELRRHELPPTGAERFSAGKSKATMSAFRAWLSRSRVEAGRGPREKRKPATF